MNNVTALLAELKTKGIEVRLEDGRAKLVGPKDALTEDLIARLREHKSEIIAALRHLETEPMPTRPCFSCGSVRFWQRPDGGWACVQCHPAPTNDMPEVVALRNLRDSLGKAVIELAEAAGWPKLALDGHRTIVGTRHAWVAFARTADVPTLRLAVERLREMLAAVTSD